MNIKKIFMCALFCLTVLFATISQAAESPSHRQKIRVLLDWFANPDHAPLFVAENQGFFAKEGLDVELIGPADPTDPPKLVAAGKADVAITYQPQFVEQVSHGLPLQPIGTLIDKPLTCIAVLQSSPIKTLADLKGKRIGHSYSSINSIMLKVMLEKHHLSMQDVQHINIHYNLTQALLSQKIDAVTGMIRTFEIIQLELAGHPARVFFPENNGVPSYSELIFVVEKHHAQEKKYALFIKAVQHGVNYLRQHPEESWKIFAKSHPELNNTLNHRAWFATLPYFANHPADMNQAAWAKFEKFIQQQK